MFYDAFGREYYLDIDGITEKCRIPSKPTNKPKSRRKIKKTEDEDIVEIDMSENENDDQSINIFKYEIIKMCIERILLSFDDENQQKIGGISTGENNVSYKIALNTLINNKILIEM